MANILATVFLVVSTAAVSHGYEKTNAQSLNGPPSFHGYDPYRDPPPVVQSGYFLALQTMADSGSWLECTSHGCSRGTCGGRLLDWDEWRDCHGQVFKIFRRDGHGVVRVGDYVSMIQFKTSQWLDCDSHTCRLSNCGGNPSIEDGFEDSARWCDCHGSSFRIAAYNKTIGTPIYAGDAVMLYGTSDRSYILLGSSDCTKTICPGSVFPPSLDSYDKCYGATFRLNY
jgi:hypothetical protein